MHLLACSAAAAGGCASTTAPAPSQRVAIPPPAPEAPAASTAAPTPPATEQPSATEAPADNLGHTQYSLVSAQGYTPVFGARVVLGFGSAGAFVSLADEDTIGFYAGCNSYQGSYHLCGAELCVERVGFTELGCDSEYENPDDWLLEFVGSKPKLVRSGARLTLIGSKATLEFLDREAADPDRPLTGRTWTVEAYLSELGEMRLALQVDPTIRPARSLSFDGRAPPRSRSRAVSQR